MSLDSSLSRRSLISALGFLPALRLLGAQQQSQHKQQGAAQQDKPTFSTGVKVVNLFANVRNKNGQIVKDLTKDDFLLDEDGRAQVISYFSQESDLPLTLGLLVDTSGSQRRLIGEERSASYRFFEQVLRPEKDVAFVIHFDFETELLQDITSSRKLLEQALDNLEAPAQQQSAATSADPTDAVPLSRRWWSPPRRSDGRAVAVAAVSARAVAPSSTMRSCWPPTNSCASRLAARR